MNILRFSLSSATDTVSASVSKADRILLRVTEDTRVAIDEGQITTDYFVVSGGSTLVLDPPNYIKNYPLFFRLDSATSGTVEIWLQGAIL